MTSSSSPSKFPSKKKELPDRIIIERHIMENNVTPRCNKCGKSMTQHKWIERGIYTISNTVTIAGKGPSSSMISKCLSCKG
jgi:hypothetical protein